MIITSALLTRNKIVAIIGTSISILLVLIERIRWLVDVFSYGFINTQERVFLFLFGCIVGICDFLFYVSIVVFCSVSLHNKSQYPKKSLAKFVFLPIIFHVITTIASIVDFIKNVNELTEYYEFFDKEVIWWVVRWLLSFGVIQTFFILLVIWAATYPKYKTITPIIYVEKSIKSEPLPQNSETVKDGYYDMVSHIILLIVTFGVYGFIWIYRTTKYLNNCKNAEQRNPTSKLLLCILVPFYFIYWTYRSAQRIDMMAKEKNVQSDISTLCVVLAILIPIVAPIIMQSKINDICAANQPKEMHENNEEHTQGDIYEVLEKLKKLYDDGIITQEEFEAKKKQILGI